MLEKIEQEIKKILEVVKLCPANLQEKCFEVLLTALLNNYTCKASVGGKHGGETDQKNQETGGKSVDDLKQEEIKITDLHLKAKKLLDQGVTLSEINNIFYKENGELKPVFDDLKSSKMSESQIKLALLEALKNAIQTGDFKFDTFYIRQQCDAYKCFDSANFASNFKKQNKLFNEVYRNGIAMSLTTEGKNELIKVIKELAS
ncbi:MAG: hypothetical protein PHV78_02500 [Patescibacteria group bacterium]|nr:hypothetical protein [Patescibacteria group bacterium]MDD5120985.1 hypothetical protein [Patescibacteria group bacterium]MDD5222139.1 hypothetical protein [Patescibacteria group bacterium]MDD5396096.1 hypothetical protein [Patescibacteria group bacterium]